MICQVCNRKLKKINSYSFKCIDCGCYFSNLKPSVGQDIEGIESLRRKNFKKLIKKILKYNVNPKILEIGSGDGYFIDECDIANIQITGSEASLKSLKRLKLIYGEKILKVHLPNSIKTDLKFDIIIFNDVFEHLEKLNDEGGLKPGNKRRGSLLEREEEMIGEGPHKEWRRIRIDERDCLDCKWRLKDSYFIDKFGIRHEKLLPISEL